MTSPALTIVSLQALRLERERRNGYFPDVKWVCHKECYGMRSPFWKLCSRCIKRIRANNTEHTVVPVVGTAIHIFSQMGRNVAATLTELTTFFRKTPNIIYTSPPNYKISAVPAQYKNSTRDMEGVYWGLLPQLRRFKVSFLDVFQLTHSCFFENCTSDGGHRSRFVNRWKAQLLLNSLCDYTAL